MMGRGGRREGAGRKPADPSDRRIVIAAKVLPETRERLRELKAKGYNVGAVLDEAVKDYFDNRK